MLQILTIYSFTTWNDNLNHKFSTIILLFTFPLINKFIANMKPLTFIHKSIPSAIIWYLFILNPFHVFASQTPSTHVTLQHHTSTHDSWKDEKWKEKLPLILQKRKTLHRFMLPSYKSYQQPNEYDEGCEVFLLGTAHISSSSCEDVKLLMNHVHPGTKSTMPSITNYI